MEYPTLCRGRSPHSRIHVNIKSLRPSRIVENEACIVNLLKVFQFRVRISLHLPKWGQSNTYSLRVYYTHPSSSQFPPTHPNALLVKWSSPLACQPNLPIFPMLLFLSASSQGGGPRSYFSNQSRILPTLLILRNFALDAYESE